MVRMRLVKSCTAALLATAGVQGHAAGTLDGHITASITLTSSCLVVGAGTTSSGIDLGTLNFGSRPATFTGFVTAVPSATSGGANTQVICSPDVGGVSISINGGSNQGQGTTVGAGTRAMRTAFGTGFAYLPYEVYRDSAYGTAYPLSTAVTGISVADGNGVSGNAIDLPIYARINKTSTAPLPAGSYLDTLLVTLNY